MEPSADTEPAEAAPRVSLGGLFRVFLTAGAVSFGGGVLAYLREYLVRGKKWVDDEDFLSALEIAETLPGLNSVNVAVIVGDNLRGVAGVIAAVTGLLVPGTIVVMTLGVVWEQHRHNPAVSTFLLGIAAAAAGLLLVVSLQLGRHQFTQFPDLLIVFATFIAVSIFRVPLLIVLATLGLLSVWLYRPTVGHKRAPSPPTEHLPFHRGSRHHHLRR
ncbi:MAG TPA: chromate transporter [Candidatus Binataceae bacterium]|nr:chromate transporter [Candidatus Binataceae bacterium]